MVAPTTRTLTTTTLFMLALVTLVTQSTSQAAPLDGTAPAAGRYFLQPLGLEALDRSSDAFLGSALALDGDTLVAGAPGATIDGKHNQGALTVFVRDGDEWVAAQQLTAVDGEAGDGLGSAVVIAGDTILAGAPGADAGGLADRGSVYRFTRQGGVWGPSGTLAPDAGSTAGGFGGAVDLAGATAVIGAPGEPAGSGLGAVYLFGQSGGVWRQQDRVSAPDGARFGASLALDGDRFIAGAPHSAVNGETKRGAAYVYVRVQDAWSLEQKLIAAEGGPSDLFGHAVALDGATAAAGAPGDLSNIPGAAYVFSREGSAWSQQQRLANLEAGQQSKYGSALALHGDLLAAGARAANVGDREFTGAVFVYAPQGTVWELQQQVAAPYAGGFDAFGAALAVDKERLAIGAPLADQPGFSASGRVYVTVRGPEAWPRTGAHAVNDVRTGGGYYHVAIAGDTALVGVPAATVDNMPYRGLAYVYERSGSGWQLVQTLTADDGAAGNYFGGAVAIAGDTAFITASWVATGQFTAGVVYVFTRDGGAWRWQQTLSGGDEESINSFGQALAMDGERALIGAHGAAFTFTRGAAGWTPEQRLNAVETDGVDYFGTAVALDGDTALVGAPYGGAGGQGVAYLFARSDVSWQPPQTLAAADGLQNDRFGLSVGLAGDTAVVGADWAAVGENDRQGAAYAFHRQGSTWQQIQKLTAPDGGTDDWFGAALALEESLLLVGAPGAPQGPLAEQGAVYAFAWQGSSWDWEQKAAPYGADTQFGATIALDGQHALVGTYDSVGSGPGGGGPDHAVFFARRTVVNGPAEGIYLPMVSR